MSVKDPEEHFVTVPPGIRLRVVLSGPESGPVVLFSNSLGSDLSMWDGVVKALPTEVRCVRYDTRGHGRSEQIPGPYTLEDLGGDAIAIMDAIGLSRATVCGLSLGGVTAQWLALHAPNRVSSLILANTGAHLPSPQMWQERSAIARTSGLRSLVAPTMERWFTPAFREREPAFVARQAEMLAGTSPEGYAGCCEALASADLRPELASISVPTLVIVGADDPSTPPALGEEIRNGVPGARLVSLQAAHLSALEVPREFASAIRDVIG